MVALCTWLDLIPQMTESWSQQSLVWALWVILLPMGCYPLPPHSTVLHLVSLEDTEPPKTFPLHAVGSGAMPSPVCGRLEQPMHAEMVTAASRSGSCLHSSATRICSFHPGWPEGEQEFGITPPLLNHCLLSLAPHPARGKPLRPPASIAPPAPAAPCPGLEEQPHAHSPTSGPPRAHPALAWCWPPPAPPGLFASP